MMKRLYFVLFFISQLFCQAQDLNPYESTQISVITIGPGTSLNDAFGHNGIRVKTLYNDVVYDYGRFPFNDPNFYLNFARGKLLYSQGFSPYTNVINFYKGQNRSIKEQILNLTTQEKQDMHAYLVNNSSPENKDYLYDFFYDNCATKIRDVTEIICNNNITFHTPSALKENTFRGLIQQNVHWNSWGGLGIDIALGSLIDKNATAYEHMFLPEYIHEFFELATLNPSGDKLVNESFEINAVTKTKKANSFFISPVFLLSLIAFFVLWITYKNHKNEKRSKWLDFSIFIITGIIGVFVLLLWFATDHTTTANNYNLLWAFALNLLFAPQMLKNSPKTWFVKYLKLLIIILCLLGFHWVLGVQRFAVALIPILIAISLRYIFLVRYFSKVK